jgi:hypothetical protein
MDEYTVLRVDGGFKYTYADQGYHRPSAEKIRLVEKGRTLGCKPGQTIQIQTHHVSKPVSNVYRIKLSITAFTLEQFVEGKSSISLLVSKDENEEISTYIGDAASVRFDWSKMKRELVMRISMRDESAKPAVNIH